MNPDGAATQPDSSLATLATPVTPGARIRTLDVLRGFALFGMIVVHFHVFMEDEAAGFEGLIGWFTWIGVETKAWGTFAFLFGVGFAVLMRSLDTKGLPVVPIYVRRMLGLAAFGFIAEALFGFHVLLEYAIWGVPLLVIRRWRSSALLFVAVAAVVWVPVVNTVEATWRRDDASAAQSAPAAERAVEAREAMEHARQNASWGELVHARLRVMEVKYTDAGTFLPGVNLALFITGLLAWRHGVFTDSRRHTRTIAGWMTFGFLSWAAWWLLYAVGPSGAGRWTTGALQGFGLVRDQWLCFTFIGAMLLLLEYRPVWSDRLSAVGMAGRMALTNYMLQVMALDWLSSGWGLGLQVRPFLSIALSALLFGALAGFSQWWLGRYRFGPAEWLWRCFTYLRWQPIRHRPSAGPVPGAA